MENPISKKLAGTSGVLGPVIAIIFIAISISLNPWFSWPDNALSDLGAIGESYNLIYNFGLIVSGIAGILLTGRLPSITNKKIGWIGTVVFGAGMFSLILIGVFPSGTSPHVTVSWAFFLLAAIGIIIIGIDQLWNSRSRPWGVFCLSIVFLAITSVILIDTIPYDLGAAIPEAIGAISISEFSISFGGRLL